MQCLTLCVFPLLSEHQTSFQVFCRYVNEGRLLGKKSVGTSVMLALNCASCIITFISTFCDSIIIYSLLSYSGYVLGCYEPLYCIVMFSSISTLYECIIMYSILSLSGYV